MKLVVKEPFATYKRGDVITDPDTVAAVLKTNPHSVVKTLADPPPPPAAT
jgi:hypothetical protein